MQAAEAQGPKSVKSRLVTEQCLALLKQYPPDIQGDVSERDLMHQGDPDSYVGLGRAALDAVRLSMLSAQKESVESILDLPSGHGRVLRALQAEFPDARLAACDIDHDAVDFCASTFGAKPVYGFEHPRDVALEDTYDLVWCGSLLTHLDASMWAEFLDFFEAALAGWGLLVFTVHGRSIVKRLLDPELGPFYMPTGEKRDGILADYENKGFGYADYDLPEEQREALSQPARYGISLAKPEFVIAQLQARPDLQLVTYIEDRWGGQDVIGCVRVGDGPSPVWIPLGGLS